MTMVVVEVMGQLYLLLRLLLVIVIQVLEVVTAIKRVGVVIVDITIAVDIVYIVAANIIASADVLTFSMSNAIIVAVWRLNIVLRAALVAVAIKGAASALLELLQRIAREGGEILIMVGCAQVRAGASLLRLVLAGRVRRVRAI